MKYLIMAILLYIIIASISFIYLYIGCVALSDVLLWTDMAKGIFFIKYYCFEMPKVIEEEARSEREKQEMYKYYRLCKILFYIAYPLWLISLIIVTIIDIFRNKKTEGQ